MSSPIATLIPSIEFMINYILELRVLQPLRRRLRNNLIAARIYQKLMGIPPIVENSLERILRLQQSELDAIPVSNRAVTFAFVLELGIYESEEEHVARTLLSLISQDYPHWQMILVGELKDSSLLMDHRISQSLADIENVDFVAEIYSGDQLHSKALSTVANSATAESDVIYTDHLVSGLHPIFKPQWNPELAYSSFYFGNGTFYRLRAFSNIYQWIGFDSHYQRTLHLRNDQISVEHLPWLLIDSHCEPHNFYATSDLTVLNEHLKPKGATATQGESVNSFRVKWAHPDELPLVSIIIPTRNGEALVRQCIESVYTTTTYPRFEVLLVDNQSDDLDALDYFNDLDSAGSVRLIKYNKPFNYSAINNFAAKHAEGDILVLLNNDIELISPHWLDEMVCQLNRPHIGCVGAKLYYPNDSIQHAGVVVGLGRCAGHSHKHFDRYADGHMQRLKQVQNYTAVTGACLGIRKSVFFEVGGLNEVDLCVAFNDVDLCLKVGKAGYDIIWSPYIEAYHHESVSRGNDHSPENYARYMSEVNYMQKTWQLDTIVDPAYSPWLTIEREDFSI